MSNSEAQQVNQMLVAAKPRYPSGSSTTYYDENYGRFLPTDLNAAILDIGCGPGDFVHFLRGRGYRNIIAVDVDQPAVASLEGLDGITAIHCQMDGPTLAKMGRKWDLIVAKQMIIYLDRHQAPDFIRDWGSAGRRWPGNCRRVQRRPIVEPFHRTQGSWHSNGLY